MLVFGHLILISLLSFFGYSTSIVQSNCIEKPVPQKFGILTTTYIRKGVTKMFLDYLQRYAMSDCQLYDNIYIIWNNQLSPEQMGVLKNKHRWKKNVYFMQTIQNSLDFKYIIPPWAPEKVFFNMDDDFGISCQSLKLGFQKWQNKSFGQLSPLASFYARSFVFDVMLQKFTYVDQVTLNKKWKYYHFGLTGIAFISRHLLDLYYSDIYQIKEMRKQVVQKFNCQDLLLNFLIEYLYPELITQYLKIPFESYGTVGVSATKTHKTYRAECITKFSVILGYNPIRYISTRTVPQYLQHFTNLNMKCMVNLKQDHFEQNFLNSKAYYRYIKNITGIQNQFILQQNEKLREAKNQIIEYVRYKESNPSQVIMPVATSTEISTTTQIAKSQKYTEIYLQQMNLHFGSLKQLKKTSLGIDYVIQIPKINSNTNSPVNRNANTNFGTNANGDTINEVNSKNTQQKNQNNNQNNNEQQEQTNQQSQQKINSQITSNIPLQVNKIINKDQLTNFNLEKNQQHLKNVQDKLLNNYQTSSLNNQQTSQSKIISFKQEIPNINAKNNQNILQHTKISQIKNYPEQPTSQAFEKIIYLLLLTLLFIIVLCVKNIYQKKKKKYYSLPKLGQAREEENFSSEIKESQGEIAK